MSLCLSPLSVSVWVPWDEHCRCRTSFDPPPCVAAGHSVAEKAGASDFGCPPPARSVCPWVERRHCGCKRSRQRQCCHLDGLRSPLQGKHLWCFWGSLLPSCWRPRRTRTPVWTDNCLASYVEISLITTHKQITEDVKQVYLLGFKAEKQVAQIRLSSLRLLSVYYPLLQTFLPRKETSFGPEFANRF